jgi:hypothetical protein
MRYTIEGFDQDEAMKLRKTIIENGKSKTIGLDCTDLVLLRWFVDFFPVMTKVTIEGVQYAWVNYQSVIDDVPLLGLGKRSLFDRLRKMSQLGVLDHRTVRRGGTFSYYGFGENYDLLVRKCDACHVQDNADPMKQTSDPMKQTSDPMKQTSDPMKQTSEGMKQTSDPTKQTSEGTKQTSEGTKQTSEGYEANFRGGMKLASEQNNSSIKYNPSTKPIHIEGGAKRKRFVPPTIEEVRAYCNERNNSVDAQKFLDYYEMTGWHTKGGATIKDWKACIRTWERNTRSDRTHTPQRQKPMSEETRKTIAALEEFTF